MFDLIFLMFDLDFKNSNVQDCATKECREKRLFYTQRSQVPLPSSKCIRRLLQTRQGESTSNELPAFGDATFCGSLVEQKKHFPSFAGMLAEKLSEAGYEHQERHVLII